MPDDSPHTTGGIGLLGTKPSHQAMQNCDTLLMVGTSFPYIEFSPPGHARKCRSTSIPLRIGLRCPVEVGMVGDARRTPAADPLLERHHDRSFLQQAQQGIQEWNQLMIDRGSRDDEPMKPQVVACELGKRLADDAPSPATRARSLPGGPGIPAKRGQKFSSPAIWLDGLRTALHDRRSDRLSRSAVRRIRRRRAFSMLMAEMVTAVKYKLPIKMVVIKNTHLGQIKWEQMVFWQSLNTAANWNRSTSSRSRAWRARAFRIESPTSAARSRL